MNRALLGDQEGDQHAGPDNVEKMPIAGTMIDGPMTLVIIPVSACLKNDEAEEYHTAQNVKCMDERQSE